MKRIAISIIMLSILLGAMFPIRANAEAIAKQSQIKYKKEFCYHQDGTDNFDESAKIVEDFAVEYFRNVGERIIWTTNIVDNQQVTEVKYIVESATSAAKETFLKTIECSDMFQIGEILDAETAESAHRAFEKDPIMAAMNTIMDGKTLDDPERGRIYELWSSNNVPVYWDIERYEDDIYTLEVALGKYVIKSGDCLSEIAQTFYITPEELIKENQHITNPDLIFAGDYLVIPSELLFGK